MKFQIKHRWSGAVLFELETDSFRLCVEAAVKARANLAFAYLARAYLARADLAFADLAGANLADANLADANLADADLAGANLAGANLAGANLARADLAGAKLSDSLTLVGQRPVLQIGPIGSRSALLSAYLTDGGVYVRTGCFFGTLAEFSEAVQEEHGDCEYGVEYRSAIALIECHASLWMPKAEAPLEAA